MKVTQEPRWYALKIFFNRVFPFQEDLNAAGWETYVPMHKVELFENGELKYVEKQIIHSLLFVKCPEIFLFDYKRDHFNDLMYYADLQTKRPAPIEDKEMQVFILVTSAKNGSVQYLGDDAPKYHVGDRVRVTDGIYKGAEGHIKRIKKDRKLVVCVTGVAVIAISHIDPAFLEKI